jgi:hypothetical protein
LIVPPDNKNGIKRTNSQIFAFFLRSQPLCFAVARIFVSCVTYPGAVRESFRRKLRSSLLLVVLPGGQALALRDRIVPVVLLSLSANKSVI